MTSLKLNFIKTTALAIKKPRIRIFRAYYGGQITAKRKKFSVFPSSLPELATDTSDASVLFAGNTVQFV